MIYSSQSLMLLHLFPSLNKHSVLCMELQNGEFIPSFVPKSSLARFWYLTAILQLHIKYELIMTKPTNWLVWPAKTRISLCPVWSGTHCFFKRIAKTDQNGHTGHWGDFVMLWLICSYILTHGIWLTYVTICVLICLIAMVKKTFDENMSTCSIPMLCDRTKLDFPWKISKLDFCEVQSLNKQ